MLEILKIPCEVGEVSDGFHTFNELYDHRNSLFIALMASRPGESWISHRHADGTILDGWFIAGMRLFEPITYHLPNRFWTLCSAAEIQIVERAPKWDGHTSADVLKRIETWIIS